MLIDKPDQPDEPDRPSEPEDGKVGPAADWQSKTITDIRFEASDPEASFELELGPTHDRYDVGPLLGSGGMGEVFEARDRLFDRAVAVKKLRSTIAPAAFFREAKTSGLLNHSNIPQVHDIGLDSEGTPYYVMQLIRGRNFADILRERDRSPAMWSLPRLLSLFRQVCAAISYAHDRGLLHLDVKPSNIMIGEDEQLYVVDWGLATPSHDMTTEIRGTPAYMSPEQAAGGQELTSASDVFSLGVVLYEVCAARQAFLGDSRDEVLERVRRAEFDRNEGWHSVPNDLQEIILGTLNHSPTQRPSASQLSLSVQEILDGSKRRAEQLQLAQDVLLRSRQHMDHRQALAKECEELEERIVELEPESWVPASRRSDFWRACDQLRQAQVDREIELERAANRVLEAYRLAPDEPEVVAAVGDFCWDQFVAAEAAQQHFQMEFFRSQLLQLSTERYKRRLAATASLFVRVADEANQMLYRLIETGPLLQLSREDIPQSQWRHLTAGDYVLEVESSGVEKTTVPLRLARGQDLEIAPKLRSAEEIGEGFVFVPEGEFVMGGDADTFESVPRQRVYLNDYCILRHPISWSDYREYLQRRLDGGETVEEWLPSTASKSGRAWGVVDGQVAYDCDAETAKDKQESALRRDFPLFGVTWFQAKEYCRWRSESGPYVYDLPTDEEWEKAARGVDERTFPWGNHFDPSLCHNVGALEEGATPGPIGAFRHDVSPYGVRDLAGGVREWCSSWFDRKNDFRLVRGGSWNFGKIGTHCAYRLGCTPDHAYHFIGFRVVHRFQPSENASSEG